MTFSPAVERAIKRFEQQVAARPNHKPSAEELERRERFRVASMIEEAARTNSQFGTWFSRGGFGHDE